MTLHSGLTTTDIHVVHAYEYANAAARTGASGFASTDIGKVARQTDNETFWVLTATTPTWVQLDATSDHGTLTGKSDDDHTQYLLLAGRSGGQIAYGGTASGNDLTLHSTSNATKGSIFLGANSAYDQVNDRLGIGTTSPDEKLQVGDNTDVSAIIGKAHIGYDGTSADRATFAHLDAASSTNYALQQLSTGTTLLNAASGQDIKFRVANVDQMILDSSGNVGIGTTSPDTKTHIFGGSAGSVTAPANTILTVEGSSNGFISLLTPDANTGGIKFGDASDNDVGSLLYNHSIPAMLFYVENSERMRIDSSGNVGIGDTSMTQKLEVASNTDVSALIGRAHIGYDGTNADRATFAHLDSMSSTGYALQQLSTGTTLLNAASGQDIKLRIAQVDKVIIDSSGNLGIGTTSPSELLDVNSDAIRIRSSQTPASAGATGTAGMICWDSSYIYVCVATDTWKRVAISTW